MDPDALTWQWAASEASEAVHQYDDALRWLTASKPSAATPVATEAWVFTPDYGRVLLVQHRWRGWVPPGGKVDPGEHPYAGARREVAEETGLNVEPIRKPAACAVRSFHEAWTPTLALSYAAVVAESHCQGETGQPAAWTDLHTPWESCFPDDFLRIRRHRDWLQERVTRTS